MKPKSRDRMYNSFKYRSIFSVLMAIFMLVFLYYLTYEPHKKKYPEPVAQIPDGASVQVFQVVDGDTLKVRMGDGDRIASVRVLGIDCPESMKNSKCERDGKQGRHGCRWQIPRGKLAKRAAEELLDNEKVVLECGGKCRKGSYGRFLRYIRLKNGMDFGQEMVRRGLCEDFAWKYPHKRALSYLRAQTMAKQSHKGIWHVE